MCDMRGSVDLRFNDSMFIYLILDFLRVSNDFSVHGAEVTENTAYSVVLHVNFSLRRQQEELKYISGGILISIIFISLITAA